MLSIITFLPLIATLICAVLPRENTTTARWVAAIVSAVNLLIVVVITCGFNPIGIDQYVEKVLWIESLSIHYSMGLDGISLSMLVLSVLLTFLAVLASWKIENKPSFYFAMLMLLAVGMNGVFLARDLILFYFFWELVLIPMYFLIGQWGGPRRAYASLKFFLYTFFGSVFMLVGIVILYLNAQSFDMHELVGVGNGLPIALQTMLFFFFFLGFGVKVPIWPLHTWLPDAHVEAPTAVSAILAGVLLKMGLYGFIRIMIPVLPEAFASWSVFIAILGVISIVYAALAAYAQTDVKKLVAYSSVSHMGFAMLALAAMNVIGLNASLAIGFSHGLISAMLFLVVGMIYDRAHTRDMALLSGIAKQTPLIGGLMMFASVAAVGVPGMSGFVGEFLALVGAWNSALPSILVVVALLGVLLGAVYMLTLIKRVVYGAPSEVYATAVDASLREIMTVAVLIVLIVAIGLYWNGLIAYFDPAVQSIVATLGA